MTARFGIVALCLAVLAAAGVFATKDQVRRLERDLRQVRAAMATERNALNRLRTEWAMLNEPGRLARLASVHLKLQPAHPGQILRVTDIPLRVDLELGRQPLRAVLPSGAEVTLRFKPRPRLRRIVQAVAAGRQHAQRE